MAYTGTSGQCLDASKQFGKQERLDQIVVRAKFQAPAERICPAIQKAGVPGMSFGSMEGFLAAKTLVEGLRRTGRDLTRARLAAALETMNNWDAGGFTVSFTPDNHNGSRFVEMTMIGAGGHFVH